MAHICIVEDRDSFREMLRLALSERGHSLSEAVSGEAALAALRRERFDVVITDLRLGEVDGLAVLAAARAQDDPPEVLVITAHGTVAEAVEAMKRGARDFLEKPFALEVLEARLDKALEERRLSREAVALEEQVRERSGLPRLLPREVAALIEKVAAAPTPVLITGESGTGKEVAARALHQRGPRAARPFIAVNCAALAESLLESELFGHEAGAFTGATGAHKGRFELADTGTLFLDEVGEISLPLQVKLLRFLQEKSFERVGGTETLKVDVRIVAATNRDLKSEIARGRFREDLYYRINVINLHLPALRERPGRIAPLVEHFLDRANAALHKNVVCGADTLGALLSYRWPGNIRELENVIERGVVLSEGGLLRIEDLPEELRAGVRTAESDALAGLKPVRELERDLLLAALERQHWNQSRAARELGLGRTSLQYKMKKYRLEPPTRRDEG